MKRFLIYLSLAVLLPFIDLPGGEALAQRTGKARVDTLVLKESISPAMIFRRIEGAWRKSDARYLAGLVGDGKVYIVMGEMGPKSGYYSSSQVFYLLKKIFREYSQMKFEFVKYHNVDKPGRKVFAVAYRSYKNIRSDRVFQDKVYITLCKEGDDWVMTEIKTSR